MTEIRVMVTGAEVAVQKTGPLTTGMVGVPVHFTFSREWDGLNIIPVFRAGDVKKDNYLKDNRSEVPHEVLAVSGEDLQIGVEGRNADGTLVIPTVWTDKIRILSGARATGDLALEPTPSQFDRFMNEVGKIDEKIETALNEAKESGAFQGEKGEDGASAHIGENGNWWIGDEDTGVEAAMNAVCYTKQNPTYEQKVQARENIHAAAPVVIEKFGNPVTVTDGTERSLQGVKLYGKTEQKLPYGNLFDGEMEVGVIEQDTGLPADGDNAVRSVNFIAVRGGATIRVADEADHYVYVFEYDENKVYTGIVSLDLTVKLQNKTRYIKIQSDEMDEQTDTSVQYTVAYTEHFDPSLERPVYPVSTGDSGAIKVTINEQTYNIPTPNGLPGIPDDTDGNYTDENGQKWYCDEIDFVHGVYVQRVKRMVFDGTQEYTETFFGGMDTYTYRAPGIMIQPNKAEKAKVFCSHLMPHSYENAQLNQDGICVSPYSGNESIGLTAFHEISHEEAATQYAAGTPITVWYRLAEPIKRPLTDKELAIYEQMRMNAPVTTITNYAGAGMSVAYAVDTKTYIDNKIASIPHEVWRFTLTDGNTVDKEVLAR